MTDYTALIARLRLLQRYHGDNDAGEAADALEAQARRIEWLEEAHRKLKAKYIVELKDAISVKELAAARIAELEAENEELKKAISKPWMGSARTALEKKDG